MPFGFLLTISSAFNLLFKVLFTFPSQYLFAIGFSKIFSLRWNLPPHLSCNLKQPDSLNEQHNQIATKVSYGILTLYDTLFQEIYTRVDYLVMIKHKLQFNTWNTGLILNLGFVLFIRHY